MTSAPRGRRAGSPTPGEGFPRPWPQAVAGLAKQISGFRLGTSVPFPYVRALWEVSKVLGLSSLFLGFDKVLVISPYIGISGKPWISLALSTEQSPMLQLPLSSSCRPNCLALRAIVWVWFLVLVLFISVLKYILYIC